MPPMNATFERAQRGEPDAMSAVLTEVAPAVQRFALRLCRDVHDAKGVSQDALIAIAKNLGRYDGRGSLSTWAFTLARTACVRKRRGLENRPAEHAELLAAAADAPDPVVVAELRQLSVHLERALLRLPSDQREVLVLHELEGLDTEAAPTRLGISQQALESRLLRARRALRDLLSDLLV